MKLPPDIPVKWDFSVSDETTLSTNKLLDLLDDPGITKLAQEALRNNPDIGATSDRLLAQAALLGASKSKLWPSIDLDLTTSRGNQTTDSEGEHTVLSLLQAGIGVSWELDIWGKIRDRHNADSVSLDIQRIEYTAARDSLIARTIQAWIRTVSLKNSIQISEKRIINLEKIKERILFRYRDGIGSIDELSTAKTRILGAKADISELMEMHAQSIRELEMVLGRYPINLLTSGRKYPVLRIPSIFKPGEVLINRPDIKVALQQVRAAQLQQSASEKDYLPSLLVTGKLFKENLKLSDLMNGQLLWDMILSASQPIFNAGRINKEIEAGKWEHSAAVKDLKAVIINAVGEVKKYWGLEQMLSRKGVLLQSAEEEAVKSYEYFEKRYLDGLDPIVNMLNAKEEQITLKRQINELQAARLVNRIDLALALGLGENDER